MKPDAIAATISDLPRCSPSDSSKDAPERRDPADELIDLLAQLEPVLLDLDEHRQRRQEHLGNCGVEPDRRAAAQLVEGRD